ncbi:hypothetical protein Tco_0837681 [Tanacetum coccineum]
MIWKNGSDSRLYKSHLAKHYLHEVDNIEDKKENLTWSFRRAPRSGVEQDQLTDLTTYVEGVVLGVTPDRWYWTLDGSVCVLVASARKVIEDQQFLEMCLLKLNG